MKISIALATYNGARFLREQLDSLAQQTRVPDELIACDDGSTDDTLAILEEFARTASFAVRVYRNETNLGFNGNFQRALSLCEGDVIFISDQDDVWFSNKLQTVSDALEQDPSALSIINDEAIADEDARPVGVTFLENVRKLNFPLSYHVAGCCTVLRKELLPVLLPFPAGTNYDIWIAMLADVLNTRLILEKPLQAYRRHDSNSTAAIFSLKKASGWRLVREYGLKDPRSGWRDQIRIWQLGLDRIDAHHVELVSLLSSDRVEAARVRLRDDIGAWQERLHLLSRSRLQRAPRLGSLWRSGFYDRFSGAKSALKDLVRP